MTDYNKILFMILGYHRKGPGDNEDLVDFKNWVKTINRIQAENKILDEVEVNYLDQINSNIRAGVYDV